MLKIVFLMIILFLCILINKVWGFILLLKDLGVCVKIV